MKSKSPINCDLTLLQRSLDDGLSEAEEELLSVHLSTCNSCQSELEKLAGRPDAWARVGTALKTANSPSLSRIDFEHSVEPGSATDFVVEWLEPSTAADSVGRLGDIEIQEVIGHGGMGVVLKGYQPELKRLVAIKLLAPQLAVSAASRKRFAREAQATAAILHPNVMPILTVHSSGTLPYIVMPYMTCESLQQRIDRTGPLELVDILRIGMQTASGLSAAHAQGLVHRDVKPANILLEISVDKVMLTDFGLARAIDDASITRTGVIAGTPLYMSPEQSRGEPVDARSDLFSLGSVLYTLATGRPPFRAESTYGILRRLTDETPRSVCEVTPQLPTWFGMIVDKLLAKLPEERFGSAAEFAHLLEGCLAHIQQPAVVPLPAECPKPARRTPIGRWAGLSLTAICLAAGWWGLGVIPSERTQQPTQSAAPSTATINAATPDVVPPTSISKGPDTDWDAGEDDVSGLRKDLTRWHRQAEALWESPPP